MATFKHLSHALTILGEVTSIDLDSFEVLCRSGDVFEVFIGDETRFIMVRNLDNVDFDRYPDPSGYDKNDPKKRLKKYIMEKRHVAVHGVYQEYNGRDRFDGRIVYLIQTDNGKFIFEETHWWLTQIARMADQWLDALFGEKRTYQLDDFSALYRTNLNILGLPTDDDIQECAVLSRLIYGLSSAYLLTGCERYLQAAKAGVRYQRETFRNLTHDGQYCFWSSARRRTLYGTELYQYSLNGYDANSIPLYEQIYSLAGMTQYYRITLDRDVLEDIHRTIKTFEDFFFDQSAEGGYFSHLDYVTMRPDDPSLGINQSRKNWNSIGDHISAYLLNLLCALKPLPPGADSTIQELVTTCENMLKETSKAILDHFKDPDPAIPYVDERFYQDWKPDHTYGWQKNRAVVGHNFKIVWNLTRIANYFWKDNPSYAHELMKMAVGLANSMAQVGIDSVRGGCFDTVEREPKNGMPVDFAWFNTKDSWQQEQAILAFLILHSHDPQNAEYLKCARYMEAFWNLFFLDVERKGIFFRVTDDGLPVTEGEYGNKGSHTDEAYHSCELNYFAHLYNRIYVPSENDSDNDFCLYFRPSANCGMKAINVLPDYFLPGLVRVRSVTIGGMSCDLKGGSQVPLENISLGSDIIVRFERGKSK